MLAYVATKERFLTDAPDIEDRIRDAVRRGLGLAIPVGSPEYQAWHNSLGNAMFHVVNTTEIPDDAGVAVEYRINGRRQRIDFIITGVDEIGRTNLVVVELKQWTVVEPSPLRDCVRTVVGRAQRDVAHPSYQAWSYARQLSDFYEVVRDESITIHPCAYVHNCETRAVLGAPEQRDNVDRAPLFIKGEYRDLRRHIAQRVQRGAGTAVLQRLDASALRPAKQLVDALGSMLRGNDEFALIDEQKLALESIIDVERRTSPGSKSVVIVRGGPGTGKSLIAVNGLVRLTGSQRNTRYVSKNAAPRKVYEAKLRGSKRDRDIRELFIGSDSFYALDGEPYDVLLVDEAHRLVRQGGLYGNRGVDQIAEIIAAARVAVFFVDDSQKVTWRDIGDQAEIERVARAAGATVHRRELSAQFRCAGSDEYIDWLDHLLAPDTDNATLGPTDFDFRVVESAPALREMIRARNRLANRSRLVAGYCWDWVSKRDGRRDDIVLGGGFSMKWNLVADGGAWMIAPSSVDQVGCIHTAQGLECDVIGVIIGPDLVYRDGQLRTDPFARARTDHSLKGFKSLYRADPDLALARADILIRNTYRTLLTRGMEGCYVYCADPETQAYLTAIVHNTARERGAR